MAPASGSESTIRLELAPPVARVTLHRPEALNAGDAVWVARLTEVCREIAARPDIRVAVLTGAGRAFSTGVDLTALAHGSFGMKDFAVREDAMTAIERMESTSCLQGLLS